MKTPFLNQLISAIAAGGISLASVAAWAGPDASQRQMQMQAAQAKNKLEEAKAAKGNERQMMMGEHMQMMQHMMEMGPHRGMREGGGQAPEETR